MGNQDGIRFFFDLQDKISAKLVKIEKRAITSRNKVDRAFARSSKTIQNANLKLASIEQRRVAAAQSNATKLIALEQRKTAATEKATNRAVALQKRQSDAFKRSMTRLASAAAVAFAAVAGKSLKMAGDYDAAMRSVQAKTGATGETLEKLSEQAREMGRTTVHSATEAARGQAFLAQAGFDANEVLEALPATLALATAGELDLASAADIASNVLSGFRLETDETARVADVLALAASKARTRT